MARPLLAGYTLDDPRLTVILDRQIADNARVDRELKDDAVSRYLTQPEGSIQRRPLRAYTETSKERA